MRYQVVINRKLLGYGQFVTEGRDEVNTTTINGEERPFIFASKLRAVERRTIMNVVRKVLGKNCFLQVHEKAGESGISGLCMSCPACWLFGGTYAPGEEKIQVNERTKVNYSDAYPFERIAIEDKTFNAVDEKRNITGQALGVNQIIGPGGNFINVVDIDTENEDWVKLIVWGIEHSNRYGGNVRIYGQMKNEILGIIGSDRLEVSSWDFVNNFKNLEGIKKHLEKYKNKLVKIDMTKEDIDQIVIRLDKSKEVQELKKRKEEAEGKKSKKKK
jgi:CRISPR type I-D-associated protein Csc2